MKLKHIFYLLNTIISLFCMEYLINVCANTNHIIPYVIMLYFTAVTISISITLTNFFLENWNKKLF